MALADGKVVQIIGPTVDVEFPAEQLPDILTALHIKNQSAGSTIVVEVAQHLGNNVVRAVSMQSTDGLKRCDKAINTGQPITVPVGRNTLGRLFNLLGEPIDLLGDLSTAPRLPIHRPAPNFEDQTSVSEVFETGIKVIDLLEPYAKGGKVGL
ncbi:MAG TPA: F0F1 ATP synthase subunit beta, partial [bacterium]|nr:F0F1 ATP synthase subunit beta [bacterium]